MLLKAFNDAALGLPGAALDVKWRGTQVYSIGERMFATAHAQALGTHSYSFKTSPTAYQFLIESKLARPAPYLARAGWVRLLHAGALPDQDLVAYLAEAHAIIFAKLAKATRTRLGLTHCPPTLQTGGQRRE